MKYVILIYGNPRSRAAWERFSEAERAEGYRAYGTLTEELASSGELVANEALADPSLATRLPAREGTAFASDGPFAEVKEHLMGFYVVDCESEERAIEIAGRVPEASLGLVEVRPALDLAGVDM